jgi:hypothetical protein
MADSNVIQEFFAELGFRVDRNSLKGFSDALKGGATQAVAFGNLWSDAAKEAVKGIKDIVSGTFEMAQRLDQLYFASRRVSDTATNISALKYAFEQVGLSAQQAQGAIESVQNMRTLYGKDFYRNIFMGAGLTGRETDAETVTKLMTYLRSQYVKGGSAAQTAEVLRRTYFSQYSQADIMQYDPARAARAQREYNETLKEFGVNQNQATQNAHDLEDAIRSLHMRMTVMFEALVAPELLKAFRDIVEFFNDFADSASKYLLPALNDILGPLRQLFDQLSLPAPKEFADSLVAQLTAAARVAQAAMGMINPAGKNRREKDANAHLWSIAFDRWSAIDAAGGQGSPADYGAAQAATDAALGVASTGAADWRTWGWSGGKYGPMTEQKGVGTTGLPATYTEGVAYTGPRAGKGHAVAATEAEQRYWADYAFNYAKQHKLSQDAAAAIGSAVYAEGGTPGSGPGTSTASGFFQWLRDRQDVFERTMGVAFSKSTPAQQMAFALKEFRGEVEGGKYKIDLEHGTSAEMLQRIISSYLIPDVAGTGNKNALADFRRGSQFAAHVAGGASGDFTQNNNIYVNGAQNPLATGDAVGAAVVEKTRQMRRDFRPLG